MDDPYENDDAGPTTHVRGYQQLPQDDLKEPRPDPDTEQFTQQKASGNSPLYDPCTSVYPNGTNGPRLSVQPSTYALSICTSSPDSTTTTKFKCESCNIDIPTKAFKKEGL